MKRMIVAALMALMTVAPAAAQDVYSGSTSLVVINNEWENETLSDVADGTLITMLDAFNKQDQE